MLLEYKIAYSTLLNSMKQISNCPKYFFLFSKAYLIRKGRAMGRLWEYFGVKQNKAPF